MSPYSSTIHRLSPGDLWLPDSRASAIMVNELAKEQSKLPSIVSFNTPSQCSTASSSSSVSSIPTNLNNNKSPSTDKQHPQPQPQPQQTSLSRQSSTATQRRHRADTASLKEYGECYRRLGQGTTAVVMVVRKLKEDGRSEKLYAIKQFRKQKSKESKKEYMKKLTSEFCISSTLLHKNVVETIDLVLDDKKRYCTVMEYCPGGDLFTSIMSERMTEREKACSFKQMMEGLAFIHSMGVAHRDLKPENLLLTMDGKLKITDFGVSDVFRFPWESKGRQSRGLVGSEPYIAPEAFEQKEYWGAAADVWSAGIVFYCIWFGGLVWHKAKKSDGAYAGYVRCCEQNQPFDMFRALPAGARQVITRMLNTQSDKRMTSADVLKDPWVASIPVCENSIDSTNHVHEHTAGFQPVCPVPKK